MKKILVSLLVLTMVFTLFACGKKSTPETDSKDTSSPASTATDPATNPTTGSATDSQDSETPAGGPEYGGTLRIVNTSEGAAPLGVPWEVIGIDVNLITPYGEALVLEASNGNIEPWLATDWTVDVENLKIVFNLRQGVKFHDGTPFNAEVAAWNYTKAIDGEVLNPAIIAAEATGEYELTVTLDRWANSLFPGFASHSFSMISKDAFEKNGIEWARENPVGTGPFKLKQYVHGEKIIYEKNPDYWQDGKPYLDEIEYVFIRDAMTQNVSMQASGNQAVDILNTNSAEQIIALRDGDVHVDTMPIGPVSLIPSSANEDSPLAKLEVRQAISYAIDRESIVAARGFGILTAATQFVPEGWGAHLPDSYNVSYNQQKAKELLTQAGYPDGFKTKLIAMPGMVDKDSVVAIHSMLAAVGIDAELEFPDAGGYSDYRYNGWEGMLVQHTRSLASILSTFTLYFDTRLDEETGEYYHIYMPSAWRPHEETYNAHQAAGATPEVEDALLQECHKIIMDNMIAIPIYNIYDAFIIKNNVHDTGFSLWGSGTMFMPSDAWKASN